MFNFLTDKQKRNDFLSGLVGGLVFTVLFLISSNLISNDFVYIYYAFLLFTPIYFFKSNKPFIASGIIASLLLPILLILVLFAYAIS